MSTLENKLTPSVITIDTEVIYAPVDITFPPPKETITKRFLSILMSLIGKGAKPRRNKNGEEVLLSRPDVAIDICGLHTIDHEYIFAVDTQSGCKVLLDTNVALLNFIVRSRDFTYFPLRHPDGAQIICASTISHLSTTFCTGRHDTIMYICDARGRLAFIEGVNGPSGSCVYDAVTGELLAQTDGLVIARDTLSRTFITEEKSGDCILWKPKPSRAIALGTVRCARFYSRRNGDRAVSIITDKDNVTIDIKTGLPL